MPKTKAKTRIVYKAVIALADGTFASFACNLSLEVKYEIGQKTLPKVGKLFAFRTLKQAQAFTISFPIFRCRASIADNQYICKLPANNFFTEKYIEECRKAWEKPTIPIEEYPTGTILCDWIKPLKRMQ